VQFASEYFEKTIPIEAVERIYRHETISDLTIKRLSPGMDRQSLDTELIEIGYPSK